MLLNRLSKRERKWLYLGIIIIFCIISYIFIAEPIWDDWQKLNEEIYTKERRLLKNLKMLAQEEEISDLYNEYAKNIKMKGSAEEETAEILKEIENIARANSTYITDIKPHGKAKEMDFYKEYYVELEVEADMPSLAKFIYDLQSSKQILKVRHLNLNAKAGGGNMLKGYMIVTKILIP